MSDDKFYYDKQVPASSRVSTIYEVSYDQHPYVKYTLGVVFREEGKGTWDATSVHEELGFYGRKFHTRGLASIYLRERHTEWMRERMEEVNPAYKAVRDEVRGESVPEPSPDVRSDAQRYVDSRTPRRYRSHA